MELHFDTETADRFAGIAMIAWNNYTEFMANFLPAWLYLVFPLVVFGMFALIIKLVYRNY